MLKTISLLICLVVNFQSWSQDQPINDGSYIFIQEGTLVAKTIQDSEVVIEELPSGVLDTSFIAEKSIYDGVEKVVVLSDIHGQYELTIKLLKNNSIIDEELNWNFGNGHLVIAGDIFDRGDKVTEVLWLVYKLEEQAKKAGGRVHYLLGNHEFMVLHEDLRYVHEKYIEISKLLNHRYDELFGQQSILGRWLRSKHTILRINNYTFVHGGISQSFLDNTAYDIEVINETMRKSIDRSKEEMKSANFYNTYYGRTGPIWYRGYFYDELEDVTIKNILSSTKSDHIIVGHCSNDQIVSLYDNKIFGVDSSIKKGRYGEVLFLIQNEFYRGTLDGAKIPFD